MTADHKATAVQQEGHDFCLQHTLDIEHLAIIAL